MALLTKVVARVAPIPLIWAYTITMTDVDFEELIDLTGLLCPLPVLKARKRLDAMQSGHVLKVLASDPMSAIDMPHFCSEQGHILLANTQDGDLFTFRIKRR
ncbi:MAG: sulfurtransferase TusA family protein [Aestuariivirga sp.]